MVSPTMSPQLRYTNNQLTVEPCALMMLKPSDDVVVTDHEKGAEEKRSFTTVPNDTGWVKNIHMPSSSTPGERIR